MNILILFLTFFKVGAFTFGGGYAMLPLIEEEVIRHGWLTEARLVDFIAVSESTPGPFAVNISTYVGMTVGGWLGAAAATIGVVLPSFIIILIVAGFFDRFKKSRFVNGCMSGLKPAVIGLIGFALVNAGSAVFFPAGFAFAQMLTFSFMVSAVIFIVMLVLALKKVNPIIIICISAVVGIAVGYLSDGAIL